MDRRTVAKQLARVPTDGSFRGFPGWFLTTAAPHLRGEVPKDDRADDVGEFTVKRGFDPIAVALLILSQRMPLRALALALAHGMPIDSARQFWGELVVGTMMMVDEIAGEAAIEWRTEAHHLTPLEPDWRALVRRTKQERTNG